MAQRWRVEWPAGADRSPAAANGVAAPLSTTKTSEVTPLDDGEAGADGVDSGWTV